MRYDSIRPGKEWLDTSGKPIQAHGFQVFYDEPGKDKYIALADRWMPQWYVKPMAKQIISGMERHFKDYKPDTSPVKVDKLPGELQKHNENTYKSRYVWLPIEWDGEKPVIRWQKEWRV